MILRSKPGLQMRFPVLTIALLLCCPEGALAKDKVQLAQPVMKVEGDRLIYNTFNLPDEMAEISDDHVEPFLALLRQHRDLKVLELNSDGGSIWAAAEISRFVIDYGLDTVVVNECSSACVDILLAGETRSMMVGAKVGFHQRGWGAESIKAYYDKWHENDGWDTPFEFAEWLYQDTQVEVYKNQTYMTSRGVTAQFAIESNRPVSSGLWYPSREELEAAGVLREAP